MIKLQSLLSSIHVERLNSNWNYITSKFHLKTTRQSKEKNALGFITISYRNWASKHDLDSKFEVTTADEEWDEKGLDYQKLGFGIFTCSGLRRGCGHLDKAWRERWPLIRRPFPFLPRSGPLIWVWECLGEDLVRRFLRFSRMRISNGWDGKKKNMAPFFIIFFFFLFSLYLLHLLLLSFLKWRGAFSDTVTYVIRWNPSRETF